ncbi:MAG TPA: hypothetical protein VNQ79_04950 [Blastocatellia bacterium]|nr:hypothetical protein [Blastocatellia bacterium]
MTGHAEQAQSGGTGERTRQAESADWQTMLVLIALFGLLFLAAGMTIYECLNQ